MKKVLSILILLTMCINAILPNMAVLKVYAKNIKHNNIEVISDNSKLKNSNILELDLEKSLKEGSAGQYAPVDADRKIGSLLGKLKIANLSNNQELSVVYLKDEKTKIEIKVKKLENIDNGIQLRYFTYSWNNNNWQQDNINDRLDIHEGNNNYVNVETFINSNNNNKYDISVKEGENTPVIDIKNISKGVSLKLGDSKFHVKLSLDTVDFSIDSLSDGNIYNFYVNNQSDTIENKLAFLGIDMKNLVSIPYSTNKVDELNKLNDSDTRNDKYELDYDNGEKPASEKVGVSIRFNQPEILFLDNNGSPKKEPATKENYKIGITLTMNDNINQEGSGGILTVTIDNILNLNENEQGINIIGSNSTKPDKNKSFIKRLDSGKIELRLEDLQPSTLFTDVNIRYNVLDYNNSNINSISSTSVPYGTIFTFLKYKFTYRSGFFLALDQYKNIKGTYSLELDNTKSLEEYSDGKEEVYFNLSSQPAGGCYQIFFNPENSKERDKNIYSEKTIFNHSAKHMQLDTATDFKILDYILKPLDSYPSEDLYGTKGKLYMNLEWSMGNSKDIISMIDSQEGEEKEINVTYDIKKSLYSKPVGQGKAFARVNIKINKESETSYVLNYKVIDLKTEEEIAQGSYNLTDINGKFYANVAFEVDAQRALEDKPNENNSIDFYYPRIYFLNVMTNQNEDMQSKYDSMTLSDLLKQELPAPYDLHSKKEDIKKFTISWRHASKEILSFMKENDYSKELLNDKLNFFTNIYISQNEDKIKEVAEENNLDKKLSLVKNYKLNSKEEIEITNSQLTELRDSKVLRFEGLDLSKYYNMLSNGIDFTPEIIISGLDENQKYYIYVALGSEYIPKDKENNNIILESLFSNLIATLTGSTPNIPDDSDKVPASPVLGIKDIGLDTATIFWPYVEIPEENSKVKINYEIIRTRNKQIDNSNLIEREDLKSYYDKLQKTMPDIDKLFLRTSEIERDNKKYSPDIFNGSSFVPADTDKFQIIYKDLDLDLIDNTLISNQIYFYYVRTVRVIGNDTKYSNWSVISGTTSTLKAPINLYVDNDREDYDPESEFIIRFDAPIKNLDLLGKEYEIEYSIKEENNEFSEPRKLDSSLLKKDAKKSKEEGYIHFTYRISGLKSNTNYSIRVRMYSISTKDISAYSNTAITRTNQKQGDYDKDKNVSDWKDYFKEELLKVIKDPYWTIADSTENFVTVYRQSKFDDLIKNSIDSNIELITSKKGARTLTYYIPAQILINANNSEKGFKIILNNDIDIIIPTKAINAELNEDLITMSRKVKNKDIKDYYIKIFIETSTPHNFRNEENTLSDEIKINFELIGSEILNLNWDEEILNMYLENIEKHSSSNSIEKYIKDSLDNNISFEEMVRYFLKSVEVFKQEMIQRSDNYFTRTLKEKLNINELDLNMYILYKSTDETLAIKGYDLSSSNFGNTLEIQNFGKNKGIFTKKPGIYIFVGQILVIPGLVGNDNASKTFSIISKYDLYDILGINGYIDLDKVVTRQMFLDTIARLSGAKSGTNSTEFLLSKGYTELLGNKQSNIYLQESIYLTMVCYEIRTNTKIDSISIRNYGITSNIKNIDPKFEKSIKVALELNIYNDTNLNPRSTININKMLELLTTLDGKVNL